LTGTDEDLRIAVAAFAARPRVLVAVDFDGTLAPFVTDPLQARALPGGLEALRAAAALRGVTAAVVSGRDLATLAALTGIGPGDGIALVGSHGAEVGTQTGAQASIQAGSNTSTQAGAQTSSHTSSHSSHTSTEPADDSGFLDESATALLRVVRGELEAIRSRHPDVRLEDKPSAVVLHTRGVEPSEAAAATTAALEVGRRHTGVHVLPGKDVVELTVLEANKGSALVDLARRTGSDATLYLGDDVTDERAFAALHPESGDLTIKVGDGETVAARRLPGPEAVVELLELFVDQRRARAEAGR
jgi:trehalose 6-phosphate phosphatase